MSLWWQLHEGLETPFSAVFWLMKNMAGATCLGETLGLTRESGCDAEHRQEARQLQLRQESWTCWLFSYLTDCTDRPRAKEEF